MNAVSPELLQTIRELQLLKNLNGFSLGGGTNLAIRYNHRISIDIDLFCPDIVGRVGFQKIIEDVKKFYGDRVFGYDFPCDIDDQYIFLRMFIKNNEAIIKVEVLQNFKVMDQPEIIDGLRLLTEKDIGLFKLVSLSERASSKDVYDLEYLTDRLSVIDLYELLKMKQEIYNKESDQTIFDLDKEESPVNNPELLLKFDSFPANKSRPKHTHDRIEILQGGKTWAQARAGWRRKVRQLYNYLEKKFPDITGVDL
ncbi:MAG: nucleotidyl transferase AbiEii/AbiGii toxin family protein [Sphingobacteriales bacterium]